MKYTLTDELYRLFLKHPTISKDTRFIEKDCIYFALKGESFDGNQFAQEAIEKGAAFAVVDDPSKVQQNKHFILVEDLSLIHI